MTGSAKASIEVRPARAEDAEPLAELYRANRDYLAPFEPVRDEEFFTTRGQALRLTALLVEREQGRAYPDVIEVDGMPAGRITVTNVARGPFCSGSLGYWVAQAHSGRGVATHAVHHVVAECFGQHQLHVWRRRHSSTTGRRKRCFVAAVSPSSVRRLGTCTSPAPIWAPRTCRGRLRGCISDALEGA